MVAGFWMGILACVVGTAASVFFIWFIAEMSRREGLTSALASRALGFGMRGSILPSLVYCFMLIGFLGVESALIGQAIKYLFNLPDTLPINLAIYVPLAFVWTITVIYGIQLVTWVARIAVPAMFLFLVVWFVQNVQGPVIGQALSHGVMVPGLDPIAGFAIALNVALGTSGLVGVFAADYARYGRKASDLVPFTLAAGVLAYFVMPFIGGVITFAAFEPTFKYFLSLGLPEAAAGNAASASQGMSFVILGGLIGLLVAFFSQVKIQTMNAYGSSLGLANIFDMAFNWRPGRVYMVVIANIIGLIFIFGGVLTLIQEFLALGSLITGVWAAMLVTDYWLVRGAMKLAPQHIRSVDNLHQVNWPGVVSFIVSIAIAWWLSVSNIWPVPFMVGVPLSVILYVVLSVATQGRYSREVEEHVVRKAPA